MKPKVQLPASLKFDSDSVAPEISGSSEPTKALHQGELNDAQTQSILGNFSTEALACALTKKLSAMNAGGEGDSAADWLSEYIQGTIANTIQSIVQAEMDTHIGFAKYEHAKSESGDASFGDLPSSQSVLSSGSGEDGNGSPCQSPEASSARKSGNKQNYRNGSYARTVKTNVGKVQVQFPRDRAGTFDSFVLPKGNNDITNMQDKILTLAAHGSSTREVSEIIKTMLGVDVSHEYVHSVVEGFTSRVKEWKERSLNGKFYPFLFLDCIYFVVRNLAGVAEKRPLYVILGINQDGHKEVVDFEFIGSSESVRGWEFMLDRLQKRGLQDPLFMSSDGVVGLGKLIRAMFPTAIHQRCVVHFVRNTRDLVPSSRRAEWMKDLKAVYSAPDLPSSQEALVKLIDKWQGLARLAVNKVKQEYSTIIAPLFELPYAVRKVVYTTNAIEAVNSSLREVANKGCFKDAGSIESLLLLRIERVLSKRWSRQVPNWTKVLQGLLEYDKTKAIVSKHTGLPAF